MTTDILTDPAVPTISPVGAVDVRQTLEWLRTLERAPFTPPAPRLFDDVPSQGLLHLCSHGDQALAFEGSQDFIRRWFNWAVNTSVVSRNAQLNWYLKGHVGCLAYVCPKSTDVIKRGLARQLAWEIRRYRDIQPTVDRVIDEETGEREIIWPEVAIEKLAAERAEQFFSERIGTNARLGVVLAPPEREPDTFYSLAPMEGGPISYSQEYAA